MALGKSQAGIMTEQEGDTFLGKDVRFKGILTLEGNVRVDGRLMGELHTAGTLTIGEHVVINGNLMVGTLITSGKIEGNVIASEKIQLLRPGILIGDIRTPAISIEAGAHFHGLSNMGTGTRVESQGAPNEKYHALAAPRRRQRTTDY